jgi:hypothetical protein
MQFPILPQSAPDQAALDDDAFLTAWNAGQLPRSISPATILRIRQLQRALAVKRKEWGDGRGK